MKTRMTVTTILLLGLVLAWSSYAQQPQSASAVVVEYRFAPGTTFKASVQCEMVADANGNLQFKAFVSPFVIGGTTGTTTPTDPPPIDPNLNVRAKQYQGIANSIGDPENAKKLSALFLGMSDMVREAKIKDRAKLEQVMTSALDLFLMNDATKAKWKTFRDKLNSDWTAAVQEGYTMDQYSTLLTDVAAGLDASAEGQDAISPTMILQILQLIMSEDKLTLQTILKILAIILGL